MIGGLYFDLTWRCNIHKFIFIIPCQTNAAVKFSLTMGVGGAFAAEYIEGVFGMILANVFGSIIIHHEREPNGVGNMPP